MPPPLARGGAGVSPLNREAPFQEPPGTVDKGHIKTVPQLQSLQQRDTTTRMRLHDDIEQLNKLQTLDS